MADKRTLNQHYGKFFELCVAARLNQEVKLPTYKWENLIPSNDRKKNVSRSY